MAYGRDEITTVHPLHRHLPTMDQQEIHHILREGTVLLVLLDDLSYYLPPIKCGFTGHIIDHHHHRYLGDTNRPVPVVPIEEWPAVADPWDVARGGIYPVTGIYRHRDQWVKIRFYNDPFDWSVLDHQWFRLLTIIGQVCTEPVHIDHVLCVVSDAAIVLSGGTWDIYTPV